MADRPFMCQHGLFRHLNDGYFYTGFTDLQDGLQPQGILQSVHNHATTLQCCDVKY